MVQEEHVMGQGWGGWRFNLFGEEGWVRESLFMGIMSEPKSDGK